MQYKKGSSAVDTVEHDLRERLFSGDLEPGTPLAEVEIVERYKVSRTTAKAALENLVSSRLLTRQAHRTARVTTLNPTSVFDIYRTRGILEAEVVRSLSHIRHVPEAAYAANDEIAALVDSSPTTLVAPDMRLHIALVDAVGSERTSMMYRTLTDEIRLCMSQVQSATLLSNESITQEHRMILEYIEHGRTDDATALIDAHLSRASQRLVRQLLSQQ